MKIQFPEESAAFLEEFYKSFTANGNKVSEAFVTKVVSYSSVTAGKYGLSTRMCLITLPTGHECIGYSQVVDTANDESAVGNAIAKKRAIEEVYKVLGTIAVLFIKKG